MLQEKVAENQVPETKFLYPVFKRCLKMSEKELDNPPLVRRAQNPYMQQPSSYETLIIIYH